MQPRPSHYDIVWGGDVDDQEVNLPGGASYLDSEGDLPLRVHRFRAEADERSSGSLEVFVPEFQLLKAIVVQDLGRAAWIDKDSLDQEVLQLQGKHQRVIMWEFYVL